MISWDVIMNGRNTSQILKTNEQSNFIHSTNLTWFFDTFYERMFEICPEIRAFFVDVNIAAQGKLVAAVIAAALGMIKQPKKLRAKLTSMTEQHNGKGIKSVYYCHMGFALIYAFNHVLGSDFDKKTEHSWIKIYSFMLSIIHPIAVDYEKRNHSTTATAMTLPASHLMPNYQDT